MKTALSVIIVIAAGLAFGFLITKVPSDIFPGGDLAKEDMALPPASKDGAPPPSAKDGTAPPPSKDGTAPPGDKSSPPPTPVPPPAGPPPVEPPPTQPPPPAGPPPPPGTLGSLTTATVFNRAHGSFIKMMPIPDGVVADSRKYMIIVKTEAQRPIAAVDVTNPSNPVYLSEVAIKGWVGNIAIKGRYAYVTRPLNQGMLVIDISNPRNLTVAGSWGDGLSGSGIVIKDNYAYVGLIGSQFWSNNLRVLDISSPVSPREVGRTAFTQPPSGSESAEFAWTRSDHMVISGNFLYVAGGKTGLDIFDISNPASPVLKKNIPPPSDGATNDVYVAGSTAYVAAIEGKLQIIDVTNPASASVVGSYAGGFFDVHGVTGWGSHIAIVGYKKPAKEFNAIQILSIATPSSPSLAKEYVHSEEHPAGQGTFDFAVSSPASWSPATLIVADNNFGVRVFNIGSLSQPVTPSQTGKIFTFGEVRDGYISGSHIFELYAGNNVIAVSDISNPSAPRLVGYFETQTGSSYNKDNLAGKGSVLYVAGNDRTIIINAGNPASLAVAGQLSISGTGTKVKVSGNTLIVSYIASGSGKMRVRLYDITSPLSPAQKSDLEVSRISLKVGGTMEVSGTDLYANISAGSGLLYKVDIANIASPRLIGEYNTSGINFGPTGFTTLPYEFTVNGNYIYMARPQQVEEGQANPNDIAVLDVSGFPNVTIRGYVSIPIKLKGTELEIIGGRLFLLDVEGGLQVFDISNPSSPSLVRAQEFGSFAFHEAYDFNPSGSNIFISAIDRVEVVPF